MNSRYTILLWVVAALIDLAFILTGMVIIPELLAAPTWGTEVMGVFIMIFLLMSWVMAFFHIVQTHETKSVIQNTNPTRDCNE